jgi:glycosyltransferase involved in cell wall biosynthesis
MSSGGLKRYTAELTVALADNFQADEFVLVSDQPFVAPVPQRGMLSRGGPPRNILERRWWLWGAQCEMKRMRCELFHGTNFAVPYLPLRPSVITVLDLSPWMDPRWHHDADRVRKRTPPLLRLGIATMVITPSEAIRQRVIAHFRISSSRVVTVPLAASPMFHPVESLVSPPYFLYAGTLEPRKNLHELIGAWRAVRRHHAVDLILAGRRRPDFPELTPEPGLQLAGEVSDGELVRLYSGALAFMYPSHYEGFGLPVLEAMQCGACVFVSTDPALRDLVAGAGVSLDGATAWVEAMSQAAKDPAWVAARRDMSLRRASDFSWAHTARRTREVYEEARQRFLS